MKNKLTTLLPAVALLALSSCASTSGLTSTESDGVYYSSKDRTTQTATASTATDGQYVARNQGIDEDTNPEYSSNNSNSATGSNSEYYDDSYASRLSRFNGSSYSGLSYYSPVYTDPYFSGGYSAFSPYYGLGAGYGGFYDPFYSSMYSPFGYGLGGSYMSLSLGFGNSWGYRPYYGLGYGGIYDSFYNPYYGGGLYGYGLGYGYGGGYGSYGGYYGNSYYGGGRDYNSSKRYAPRVDRSREAISASQPTSGGRGGRIVNSGGFAAPASNGVVAPSNTSVVGNAITNPASATGRGRGRITDDSGAQPTGGFTSPSNYNLSERAMSGAEQRAREGRMTNSGVTGNTNPGAQSMEQPRIDYSGRGRRSQMVDNTGASGSAAPQDYSQPQRRSRFSEAFRNSGSDNSMNQSMPQRTFESRSSESRSFSQPTRTFSEPARMSTPSFGGGSSSGGGNSGGGGGGGRGRIR